MEDGGRRLVGQDGDGQDRFGEAVGGQCGPEPGLGLQLAEEADLRVGLERIDHPVLDVGGAPGASWAAGEDDRRIRTGGDRHGLHLIALEIDGAGIA